MVTSYRENGSPLSSAELRIFLKDKLPDYMVPSAFVVLDALPVTPNGKIDRSKLPAPKPFFNDVAVAPRTEIEELVANVWRDVLKVETIGVHDNFFELGGHSLLAIQIISRVREVFDKDVPLLALFEAPTIAGLAGKIEETISGRSHDLPPIVRVPRDGPLPLSMNQEHLWRLDRMIPGTHFFNMPYVYRLSGDLDDQALEKAVREIIRRHEALRTVFAEVDGCPVQIIRPSTNYHLPLIDLRSPSQRDPAQRAANLIVKERRTPFDLAVGPLLRIKLLRLTGTEYLLLVTAHHIIGDLGSIEVFRRELTTLYHAFTHGMPSPFPELSIQFADFAVWERKLLDGGYLDTQMNYWRKQLAAPLSMLDFQMQREQKKTFNFRTSRQAIEIDETLFSNMLSLARQENCTPVMVFLAALNVLFQMLTGGNDIRIGILVANRSSIASENVFGHLMNTLVLRNHISLDMTFKQLLRQVRIVTLAAYGHQELPFESLARAMEKEGIERSSIFQVLLIYSVELFSTQELTGLTFASLAVKSLFEENSVTISTLDLILDMKQTATKLTGVVNYTTDTVDSKIARQFNEALNSILEDSLRNVGESISTLAVRGLNFRSGGGA